MEQVPVENIMAFPQKIKNRVELPYDPATPHLGLYPKELKAVSQRDICTPMFRAALFTMAEAQQQPKCPLMDKWISKMWYIHKTEYYSALKREFQHVLQHG